MSIGSALSVAIFGGFAPYIGTWFIKELGTPIWPFYYVIAAAMVTTIVIARLQETAHQPLA
jgi:MHS family proline/betaine transporter-like MFS transporter